MSIKSNGSIANYVSASFNKSASLLNQNPLTVAAGQTNVAGNAAAVESVAHFQSSLKAVSDSLVLTGATLHSVAEEFARIDQKIAQLPPLVAAGGLK